MSLGPYVEILSSTHPNFPFWLVLNVLWSSDAPSFIEDSACICMLFISSFAELFPIYLVFPQIHFDYLDMMGK